MARGVTSSSNGRFDAGVLISKVVIDARKPVAVCLTGLTELIVAGMDKDAKHDVSFNERDELVWLSNTRNRLDIRNLPKEYKDAADASITQATNPGRHSRVVSRDVSQPAAWHCDIVDRDDVQLDVIVETISRSGGYKFILSFKPTPQKFLKISQKTPPATS